MVYEHDPKDTRQVALSPPWCWLAVVGGLAIGAVGMIGATIATSPYGHRPVAAFFLSAHTDAVEPAKSMPPAPDEQRAALNITRAHSGRPGRSGEERAANGDARRH